MSLEDVLVVMAQTFQKHSGADGKTGELNQSELANLVKVEFPKLTEKQKTRMSSSVTLEDALLFLIETFQKYAGADGDKATLSTKEAVRLIQKELPLFYGKNVDEETCNEIIDIIDTRKNGLIDFSEYITFLTYIVRRFHQDLTAPEKEK